MSAETFLREMAGALESGKFLRLTLSRPVAGEERRSVHLRPVQIQGRAQVQIVHRHVRKDVTENVSDPAALALVRECCGEKFLDAHLETTEMRLMLRHSRKGVPHLSRSRASLQQGAPLLANDRGKTGILSTEKTGWLRDLGLASADGKILPSMSHKWRQIQRFVELLDHAWRDADWPPDRPVRVTDMGAGKGYLTFAVHTWLTQHLGLVAEVTGIELRPELVDFCNSVAQKHTCAGLSFRAGEIASLQDLPVDLLLALHACDTATDDALATGLRVGARMLVCAPCCQHQVRAEMQPGEAVSGLVGHGLLRQRQAELLTDALRALILEREGCVVRVVEFVDADHTDKNLLLIATRSSSAISGKKAALQTKIEALKALFGLEKHHLETLLAG